MNNVLERAMAVSFNQMTIIATYRAMVNADNLAAPTFNAGKGNCLGLLITWATAKAAYKMLTGGLDLDPASSFSASVIIIIAC